MFTETLRLRAGDAFIASLTFTVMDIVRSTCCVVELPAGLLIHIQ